MTTNGITKAIQKLNENFEDFICVKLRLKKNSCIAKILFIKL